MEELTSRIRNEQGTVIASEPAFRATRDGDYIGQLEIEIKPAGLPERDLQDANDEIVRLRARVAELERQIAKSSRHGRAG